MVVVLRTQGAPGGLAAAARAAVREVDSDQPIANVRTLEQVVADSVAPRRFNLMLLGIFAVLALLLSAVGIYGVTAYSVAQRTRELGLRMALGAQRQGVLNLVLKEAAGLAGLGVLLGLAGAFALTRLMASLLYGVGSTDPLTFVAVAVVLTLIALVAAYLPGRRATRVDPIVALKAE
jgi:ABC-type antimicrobial peptide transport system permease subunit